MTFIYCILQKSFWMAIVYQQNCKWVLYYSVSINKIANKNQNLLLL